MFLKARIETSEALKTHSSVEARLTFTEIIDIILKSFEDQEIEELLWKSASLSNAYLALGDNANAEKYEKVFNDQHPSQWEIDTFEKTKSILRSEKHD